MSGASLSLDLTDFDRLVERFKDPVIQQELEKIPQMKAIAALVSQAIAENFNEEGPGWKALKARTIRESVSKALKEKLKKMTDQEILAYEKKARKQGGTPHRMILRKTGTLFASATTIGAKGNIYRTDKKGLIFGTNLIYAATHNYGDKARHIPKREFMDVKQQYLNEINEFVLSQVIAIVKSKLEGTS